MVITLFMEAIPDNLKPFSYIARTNDFIFIIQIGPVQVVA